eukprot:2121245-Lingulodinium_polyedra.AAC.1
MFRGRHGPRYATLLGGGGNPDGSIAYQIGELGRREEENQLAWSSWGDWRNASRLFTDDEFGVAPYLPLRAARA